MPRAMNGVAIASPGGPEVLQLTTIWPLLERRAVAPVIDSSFPLAEASRAHERMETSAHIGKIVLVVD